MQLLTPFLRVAAVAGIALWLFWAASAAYLLVLCFAAALYPLLRRGQDRGGSMPADSSEPPSTRFCVLVPAHDEELLLGATVDRLRTLDYPGDAFDVVVIADNCTDGTAAVARVYGATVLERMDAERRGKGYALDWALRELLRSQRAYDAFLILDADSYLSPDFLRVMERSLRAGHRAVQGLYLVDNVHESWRTRLMSCALALAHYVKPRGRAALGLSDGLKGNGMCFARSVLEQVPWSGESVTEDIEYTLRLVQAGIRIEFAPRAIVRAQMPATASQAASQRERWEGGRYALFRRAIGLLARSIVTFNPLVADRAVELIIPPFAELFGLPLVALVGGLAWMALAPVGTAALWWVWGWAGVLAAELLYLAAGLALARVPLPVVSSLVLAPAYVLWKLGLVGAMLMRGGPGAWRRTERH